MVSFARFAVPLLLTAIGAGGGAFADDLTIQGIVEAGDETVLSAEMAGRIDTLPLDEGAAFRKGDLLAGFACDILRAEQSVARAAVKGAQARVDNARRLDSLGVAGALDLALAEAALEEGKAQLQVADAKVRLCSVRAPFDGTILSRAVEEHESVNVMTPLLKVGREGALRVAVIAPAQWLAWIAPGTPFRFMAHGGRVPVEGRIDRIGASVDPSSQTVRLEGVLDEDAPGLIPGMGGVAAFDAPPGSAE